MPDPRREPLPKLLLLGGSHMRAIGEAARARSLTVAGGMLEAGRFLNVGFHKRRGDDLVFEDPKVDMLYRSYLASLGVDRMADLTIPVLSSIGMNVHHLSRPKVWDGLTLIGRPGARLLNRAEFTKTVREMMSGSIEFYRDATTLGVECFCALPPRRIPLDSSDAQHELFPAIENVAKVLVEQAGAIVLDHRPFSLDETGLLRPEYRHSDCDDQVHGNAAFGDLILRMMLDIMNRQPRSNTLPSRSVQRRLGLASGIGVLRSALRAFGNR